MTSKDFALKYAGRKVKFKAGDGKSYNGFVVGYGNPLTSQTIRERVICTGHPHGVHKNYDTEDFGGYGVKVVPDRNVYSKDYGWILPDDITLLDGDADDFLRNVFAPKKQIIKKKEIPEHPHICPNCKGPAYIGFNTTVDCKAKCGSKTE